MYTWYVELVLNVLEITTPHLIYVYYVYSMFKINLVHEYNNIPMIILEFMAWKLNQNKESSYLLHHLDCLVSRPFLGSWSRA